MNKLEDMARLYDLSDDTFAHEPRDLDWRNHVGGNVRAAWADLTRRERILVALTAADAAMKKHDGKLVI